MTVGSYMKSAGQSQSRGQSASRPASPTERRPGWGQNQDHLRRAVWSACRAAPAELRRETVSRIGFPTRDRPDGLKRAVVSYLENARAFGREPEVSVVDDSRAEPMVATYRRAFNELADEHGIAVRYADRRRRLLFAGELAQQAGLEPRIVRFALLGDERCPQTYGGCRNTLLLDAVGRLALQADDDTICRPAGPPERGDAQGRLVLASNTDPNELWFFGSADEALASAVDTKVDVFAVHERYLGRSPSPCIVEVAGGSEALIDVSTLDAHALAHLDSPDARIAATFLGTAGDSGALFPLRFLNRGATFRRMVASKASYRLAATSRHMIRVVQHPTISDGYACMTTHAGFDCRALLPPFMPVNRNEDGVFACLLHRLFPHWYAAFDPTTIRHIPPETRMLSARDLRERLRSCLANGTLVQLIAGFRLTDHAAASATDLCRLGQSLARLGSASETEFDDVLRSVRASTVARRLEEAEQRLDEEPEAPDYWVADVRDYLRVTRSIPAQPDSHIPADLPGSARDRMLVFRDLVRQFGELLHAWPDIFASARRLAEAGHGPAVTLSSFPRAAR